MRSKKTKEQLDIILTLDVGSRSDWNATLTAHRRIERARLGVHIEIAFRSKGSGGLAAKVRDDMASLGRSVAQGLNGGRGLPWTGLILLGSGWGDGKVAMREVHRAYHDVAPSRVRLGDGEWWPYLDALAVPKALFKKHDLFEDPSLTGTRWPCYAEIPALGRNPLQPLAVARAFLIHRVRQLLSESDSVAEEAAWPSEASSAILGPTPGPRRQMPNMWLPFDAPGSLTGLWHHGSDPITGAAVPMAVSILPVPACSRRRPLTARPR